MFIQQISRKKDRKHFTAQWDVFSAVLTARYLEPHSRRRSRRGGLFAGSCASHPLPIPPIRSQFVGTPVSSPKQPVVLRFFPGGGVSSPGTNACALLVTPNTQQCLSATHTHFETAHILLQRRPRTSSQQRIKLLPFGSSLKTAHRLELIPVPHELTRILSCVCFLLMSPRSTVSHGTCSVTMCDGLRVPAAAAHVIRQDAVCVDIELPSKTY
jgi:hypothetical protein